jgi:hypothetical protein
MIEIKDLSQLYMKQSSIQYSEGGVFEVTESSVLTIENSTFSDQVSSEIGSFLKSYPGIVSLENIEINNFISENQPLIYVSAFTSVLNIESC